MGYTDNDQDGSDLGKKASPVPFTTDDANDLNRTDIRTKRDKRWPDRPERVRRRGDILTGVSDAGILGEQPKSVLKRLEYPVSHVEAEPFCNVVPRLVQIGFGEAGKDIPAAHWLVRSLFAAARSFARATASSPSTRSPRSACSIPA